MYKRNYLVGRKFGILTVVSEAGRTNDRHIQYECVCDCGKHKVISGKELLNGHNRSCGCRQRAKYGYVRSKERLYRIWCSMHNRCKHDTKWYGTISVCDEWKDYEVFKEWAYANGYDDEAPKWKCTIDRVNPNSNYEPSNCRWVDESMQMFNRRKANSKLGVRGVYYREREGKYYAMIGKDNKQIYLGTYGRVEDAIEARRAAELKYYGMVLEA